MPLTASIFSGGSDIDPELYGHEAHPETTDVVRERDDAELALLVAALARDVPVLAICRGSQLLNVACGGDLVQHLPEVVGHEQHRHTAGVFADHEVTVERGDDPRGPRRPPRHGQVAPPPGVWSARRRSSRRRPR